MSSSRAETSVEGDHKALHSLLNLTQEARALSMKTSKQMASQADPTGEQQLAGFIEKFDSKNAALIRSVRKVLRKRLPTANELVYDNYNFFVIGYCATERPSDCILSIAAARTELGCRSITEPRYPIRIGCFSAAVAKTALSGSNRRRR